METVNRSAMQKITPILLFFSLVCTRQGLAQVPEENRFEKVVLTQNLNEPLELAILPDERVIFIERHGAVKMYDPKTRKTILIATIPVSTKYNAGPDGVQQEAEDGLLGLGVDPSFPTKPWIYLYYSPMGKEPKNILARFTFTGNKLDLASKKVILEVPVQRDQCCHTGGSIDWDAAGNLYLSTGDNTSPRESDGYAPIDQRPGRSPFDAQKSSSNTNDLRGKIIRIHPEANGGYTIPEGNLFPGGTEKTRPEIFTMGHRNPYRIAVDRKTGFLYWGDVGPDSGKDSTGLGPTAEDEFNQAQNAGNYGWPYFVGDNKPYWYYDFATKQSGEKFDPQKPLNRSPNNTGLIELPPARKAMIWYPAAESQRFPLLGSGGRSAMAGPVYHMDEFAKAKRPFPAYYNNKWFIYEWMRDWIIAVTMDAQGKYVRMERFLPNLSLEHPIDMAFGPNGDLYILEYGQGWFMANPESKLVRIEYNAGNRKPVVKASANKLAGALPLTVQFSTEGTLDHDRDSLTYTWKIQDAQGVTIATMKEANPSYRFTKAGSYTAQVTVTDAQGASTAKKISLKAGNEPPVVNLRLTNGNQSFFFPGKSLAYEVEVTDKEDGSLANKRITPAQVRVSAGYQDAIVENAGTESGHKEAPTSFQAGRLIMEKSDCKACHFKDKKSIGPSYAQIAAKYKSDKNAIERLSAKIIKGGSGVWGDVAMAPHPNIGIPEAKQIVQYILSIADEKKAVPSLPVKGTLVPKIPQGADASKGVYTLNASYTDKGYNGIAPIAARQSITLRSPTLLFGESEIVSPGIMKFKMGSSNFLIVTSSATHAAFRHIDLSGIQSITLTVAAPVDQLNAQGGIIEIRRGSPEGPILGQTEFIEPSKDPGLLTGSSMPPSYKVSVPPNSGMGDLYFIFRNEKTKGALFIPYSATFNPE